MSIVIKANVIGECARFNQSKKLQSKNVLIDKKAIRIWSFFSLDMIVENQYECHENTKTNIMN